MVLIRLILRVIHCGFHKKESTARESCSRRMTFRRKINAKTRALASLMVTAGHNSYRKAGKILKISASSIHRCCKEGVEKNRRNINGILGRPRTISKRDAAYFIRKLKKAMR